MIYREAEISDIKQIQFVRNSVKENRLSVPGSISDEDCEEFIKIRGKGWVCEISKRIVGFAIVDIKGNNVWALFVLPEFECRGIGSELHKIMMKWYFDQTNEKIWLSTEPETRAENFYKRKGWSQVGLASNGEKKFEMTHDKWLKNIIADEKL